MNGPGAGMLLFPGTAHRNRSPSTGFVDLSQTQHLHSVPQAHLGCSGLVSVCYSAGTFALLAGSSELCERFSSSSPGLRENNTKQHLVHVVLSVPSWASWQQAGGALGVTCRAAGKQDALQSSLSKCWENSCVLLGMALQGCPGEPAALQMPCAPLAV